VTCPRRTQSSNIFFVNILFLPTFKIHSCYLLENPRKIRNVLRYLIEVDKSVIENKSFLIKVYHAYRSFLMII